MASCTGKLHVCISVRFKPVLLFIPESETAVCLFAIDIVSRVRVYVCFCFVLVQTSCTGLQNPDFYITINCTKKYNNFFCSVCTDALYPDYILLYITYVNV